MSESFKARLNAALCKRNMKAVDLSEKTGISKSRISQYVNGIYVPKSKSTYLIAEALNVDEAWLMGLDVPMEKIKPTVDNDSGQSKSDKEVLEILSSLSEDKLKQAISYLRYLRDTEES